MDKKLKTNWVKALRSGRYRQGQGALKNSDGAYCCLGVLAAIQGAKWTGKWTGGVPTIKGKTVGLRDEEENLLSPTFCGLAKRTQEHLAKLNDGGSFPVTHGKSFKEIADYIEKRL